MQQVPLFFSGTPVGTNPQAELGRSMMPSIIWTAPTHVFDAVAGPAIKNGGGAHSAVGIIPRAAKHLCSREAHKIQGC